VAAKPVSLVSHTGPSGFCSFRTEESLEYYYARDSSDTSLVSSRSHVQSEEEDLVNEGAEDDGRSNRKGER
jgi:hypothetical protein